MSELRAEVRDLIEAEVEVKDDIARAKYHLFGDESS
jgi:hypothetical protein